MRVENYSARYINDIAGIVQNFHAESIGEYDSVFEPQAVLNTIQTQGEANPENVFLLILDEKCQGIIFGTRFKSMLSDRQTFQEVIWYVNKPFRRYGVRLLREAEKILISSGVGIMIMAVMENSKAEKIKAFYQRLGFKPMEQHFVRTL